MALGACLVLPQLPLRPLPRGRINDCWHHDGTPLARRPPGTALGIPRDPVFAPAWAIRLVHLPRLGAVVRGFALIQRVTEELYTTKKTNVVSLLQTIQ
jgi:hypothetical protein